MKFTLILLLIFSLSLTNSTVFGEDSALHVSFVNNAAPSYDVSFDPTKKILLEQSYSWVRDDTSRYNLISYSIDGDEFIPISRLARGIFSIDIPTGSSSIEFLSTVQYPVSIDGVSDYSFSPKSPTNDNWFDEKSEILITDITTDESRLPNDIVKWDGPIIDYSGNSVQILIDNPIHLTAHWSPNYSFFGLLVLLPIIGIVVFLKKNKGSNQPKSVIKDTEKQSDSNSDNYADEINEFLKQKSIEKLDSLIESKIITHEKGSRIKQSL